MLISNPSDSPLLSLLYTMFSVSGIALITGAGPFYSDFLLALLSGSQVAASGEPPLLRSLEQALQVYTSST